MARVDRIFDERTLVKAAGGLVWRTGRDGPRLAVIHRPKHGDWSLPKGKLKRGETFSAAAIREVAEETGCRARLGEFAGYTLYLAKRGPKLVLFWHMVATGAGAFEPNDEVDVVEWLAPEDAVARLDHPAERRLVRRVAVARGAARRRRAVAA